MAEARFLANQRARLEKNKKKAAAAEPLGDNASASFVAKFDAMARALLERDIPAATSEEQLLVCANTTLSDMRALTTDTAAALPLYEMQRAQRVLHDCQAALAQRREQLAPTRGFSFGVARAEEQQETVAAADDERTAAAIAPPRPFPEDAPAAPPLTPNANGVLNISAAEHNDLHLRDLCDATVYVTSGTEPLAALRLTRLERCRLLVASRIGNGSIFVESCTACTFLMAAQQVRVHETRACDFYVHVTGALIVEHCDALRVAPLTRGLLGAARAHVTSTTSDLEDALSDASNQWDHVEDFNWLRVEPSPHWRALADAERVRDIDDWPLL